MHCGEITAPSFFTGCDEVSTLTITVKCSFDL